MVKKDKILISLIVPVYNTSNYLLECLESISKQTLKEIEIICINDGSTDNSLNILKDYQKKDKRIIIIDQKNKGLSGARNSGLDIAKGKYIGFIDSDYINPSMYETMYKAITKYRTDIVICNYHINTNGKITTHSKKKSYLIRNKTKYIKELLEDNNIQNYVWSRLYKKELFKNIRFAEGKVLEDIYLSSDLLDKINTAYYISKPLYYYRNRENSISKTTNLNTINDAIFSYYKRYCLINYKYKYLNKINIYSMLKWLTCFRRCFNDPEPFYKIYKEIISNVIEDYKKTDISEYAKEEIYDEIMNFIDYYLKRM